MNSRLKTVDEVLAMTQGKSVVFTNGVFDILHVGHVDYLERASALGDCLVVGINTDESVRRLGKGLDRPINSLEERAFVLAGLKSVAAVVSFDEDDPRILIEKLRPKFHVKGGDYEADSMPETPLVRSYGGEVIILPLVDGFSTTGIWKKISSQEAEG